MAEHHAGGVLVLGHAPDALDARVLAHQPLHQVHIRAVRQHRHGHQFKAEVLGHGKMPVIAGHRAEELPVRHLAPGGAAQQPVDHGVAQDVEHQGQAAVAAHDHLFGAAAHHAGQQGLRLRNAVQPAVVPAVGAVHAVQHRTAVHLVQHLAGELQLFRGRFSAGEVQVQPLLLHLPIGSRQFTVLPLQFSLAHFLIAHGRSPIYCAPAGRGSFPGPSGSVRAACGCPGLPKGC